MSQKCTSFPRGADFMCYYLIVKQRIGLPENPKAALDVNETAKGSQQLNGE